MLPLIGVTCAWSPETHLCNVARDFYYIDVGYSKAIFKAGGIPVLMAPPQADEVDLEAYADEMLKKVDALYFSGGAGGGKCKLTGEKLPLYEQQPVRSAWEECLLKKAYELDIPVLGACRGHQMITVALGGSLDKDFYPPHLQKVPYHEGIHDVKIAEGSLLGKLAGTEDWHVNSIHTQKVDVAPPGFIISAWTEDGSAEAVESTEKTFFLGTQFHPELMIYDERAKGVLKAFVDAAVEYAKKK